MNRFTVQSKPLTGLQVITRQVLGDKRGSLSRLFCADELDKAGWTKPIAQINHTYTAKKGTVRGLHFQHPPYTEKKLVSCIRGEVFDVAVDLRHDSPTFLQWHGEILSASNHKAILIPEGFAHGFQTLTDNVELLYCHSKAYCQNAEAGLNPQDPRLAINWSLPIAELSARDQQHLMIDEKFTGLVL